MADVLVPELGESIVEATVGIWMKKVGDVVHAGDALVELETDKVNVEIMADEDGILQAVFRQSGEVVKIGDALASVAATIPVVATEDAIRSQRATPSIRRAALELGIDVNSVQGTGPNGRIEMRDLLARAVPSQDPAPAAPVAPPSAPAGYPGTIAPAASVAAPSPLRAEERVHMSRRRITIAKRLVEAQHTAAMLTTFNEVDMAALLDLRKRRKDAFKVKHGVGLGFMSFFTKAVVGALKAFPLLNAEVQGEDILMKRYYDIGIAVSTESGLVVPVVRNADRLGFAAIEAEIAALAKRARDNKLGLEDLQGGTFTITNGGVFGSLFSTPIINSPQVGILGMHAIKERPIAVNGQVEIRPMMYIALSYDHRIVDGSEAVQFLATVKDLVEDPESLLIDG